MPRLTRHLKQSVAIGVGALVVATLSVVAIGGAQAETTGTPGVTFFTPLDGGTTSGTFDVMLGAAPSVASVRLTSTSGTSPQVLTRKSTSDVFETSIAGVTGQVHLEATGLDANGDPVGTSAVEDVKVGTPTKFTFVRPVPAGDPLGVFRRADGHSFVRASGITNRAERPVVDAPAFGAVAPPASGLPAPTGTFQQDPKTAALGWTYREPVELTGNPGLANNRAVIRVRDSLSSEAVETPLYTQTIGSVTASSSPVPGTASTTITAKVTDQYGQPVVGAPVRLRGFANGSPSPVAQVAVSDAHDGQASFTVTGPGFYVAYVDLNLNGYQTSGEPGGPQIVVGTVTRAAPGRPLFHNNVRTPGGSGTVGDSLRGTRLAAAKHYQWIDQDGQLAFTSRAIQRAGASRVTLPTHLTWVNAHGAPFNPRWMKRGRFETRAWGMIRRRVGLRNADMTFQQDAAYGLSVEWEVKDIRPFGSPAALNAAFANLAASAQRAYGAGWQSRVEIKALSNLSGGLPYALKVLRYAHAHGFRTMLLARGAATRTQIPASAHEYVSFVRGAQAGLYANP